ncbi:MAG TPA: hypothetical protein VGG39_07430 [Polyangiaceae bacterium]|jgi:hypothetical protein
MVGDLAHIARCLDLQAQDVVDAVGSRDSARALLEHLARVSAPDTGVAKVLLVFARMATTACDWLDGDLTIDLQAEGNATRADVTTDLGGGLRERAFAPLLFHAPLVEFARAIERVPHMVAPLAVRGSTPKRVLLSATALTRRTSIPPAPVAIAPENLFVRVPPPAPTGATQPERDEPSLPVIAAASPAARGARPAVHEAQPDLHDVLPAAQPPAAPSPTSSLPPKDVDSGWDD